MGCNLSQADFCIGLSARLHGRETDDDRKAPHLTFGFPMKWSALLTIAGLLLTFAWSACWSLHLVRSVRDYRSRTKLMFSRIAFVLLMAVPILSSAGCSPNLRAPEVRGYAVAIGDNGCEFAEEMIFTKVPTSARDRRPMEQPPASFAGQCVWHNSTRSARRGLPDGFHCNPHGPTVLAGTTYKAMPGAKKVCDIPKWPVYKCVRGCTQRNVPPYFEIEPYEC